MYISCSSSLKVKEIILVFFEFFPCSLNLVFYVFSVFFLFFRIKTVFENCNQTGSNFWFLLCVVAIE